MENKNNFETWRPINGYEGLYEVSNLGRVYSKITNRIMRNNHNQYGHLKVCLSSNGKSQYHYIHRLVAEAFIPNPDCKPCLDHINTNPADNRVENLRWVSVRENNNNPLSKIKSCKGYNKRKKPIIQYSAFDNHPIAWWDSAVDASRFTGLSADLINQNLRGKCKIIGGGEFYFKYQYTEPHYNA